MMSVNYVSSVFNMAALPPCSVCNQRASGYHYGANTCEACKVSSKYTRHTGCNRHTGYSGCTRHTGYTGCTRHTRYTGCTRHTRYSGCSLLDRPDTQDTMDTPDIPVTRYNENIG